MDQGLKERLVGAAVLVAVAVWLVPWVLDGPDGSIESTGNSLQLPAAEEPMPMRTQTLRLGDPEPAAATSPQRQAAEPQAPPAETVAAESPAAAEAAPTSAATRGATAPAAEQRDEPPAAVASTAPPPRAPAPAPAQTAAVTPPKPAAAAAGDWTVQLGSFGEEANARRVAQRASTFGYKAEVSRTTSGGRTLYRVRVGPQATRAAADATASALRAHGLEASVVAAR